MPVVENLSEAVSLYGVKIYKGWRQSQALAVRKKSPGQGLRRRAQRLSVKGPKP
jgi:hypothetical protein